MHSQQPPVPETAVSSQNILPCGDAEARSSASSLDSVPLSEAPFRTALDLPRGPADLADTDQPMSPNLEHKETERISGLFRTFQRRISLAIDRNTEKGPNSDSPNEIANSWSPKSPRLFSHVRASLADLGTYIARKSTVNADESAQPAADDKAVMPEKLASSSINVSDAHLQSQAHDSNAHIISSTYSGINDSISLDSAVPIQTSDAAAVDWTELDADRLGTDLYNGLHLPPREVAPLIGKKYL